MKKAYKVNNIVLALILALILFISIPIQVISQDTNETMNILNTQYEYLSNLLTELEVLAKYASSEILSKQEKAENITEVLNEQSKKLSLLLTELDVLVKSSIENSKSLPEVVSNNTDKLNQESQYYITLLQELDVLYNAINKEADTEFIYQYDDENRLKTIKSKFSDKVIYEFQYDHNGNLLRIIEK